MLKVCYSVHTEAIGNGDCQYEETVRREEHTMISVFNRAVLFKDSDAVASAKVWSTLKKNNIEYEMKTIKNHSTIGRNVHYSMSMSIGSGGLGGSAFGDQMGYVYVIYVRKNDLSLAKKVCDL